MKKLTTYLTLTLALLTPMASAQAVQVLGHGYSQECYQQVMRGRSTTHSVEVICTKALNFESMTKANRAATYINRGVLRMRDGRYDAALADYSNAERFKADEGAIYLNEGAAHIYMQDYASAIPALDRAIALGSQDLYAAYYNRAIAKEYTDDIPGAYHDFKKALELKPEWQLAARQLERFTVRQQ